MGNKFIIMVVLIVMAVSCVIGVGAVYVGASFLRLRAKLLENGKRATATVTDVKVLTRWRDKRGVRTFLVYDCTLEFMAGYKMQTFKRSTEEVRAVGDTMEITYLPDNPGKFMSTEQLTDSPMNQIRPLAAVAIGGVLMAVVAYAIAFR